MRRPSFSRCLTFFALALLGPSVRAAEFRAPLMKRPPRVDGRIAADEWTNAAGFDGLAWEGKLERRRVQAWIGATWDTLYVALRSQLPAAGELTTKVTTDSVQLVYDDSVEVWIDPTPGSTDGRAFQIIANAAGHAAYQMHPRGAVREDPTWRGRWTVANTTHDGFWDCEITVPIHDIAPGRDALEGTWGINVCRNWKEPWAFSSLDGKAYAPSEATRFVFVSSGSPSVSHEERTDPFSGAVDSVLVLTNPNTQPVAVKAEMRLQRDLMPDIDESQTLALAPGERREVALTAAASASREHHLSMTVGPTEGGAPWYQRSVAWTAGDPDWKWKVATAAKPDVDFQFAYYPSANRMRLLADASGLSASAHVSGMTAVVRRAGSGPVVKTVRLTHLIHGRQEIAFPLPPLEGRYEVALKAEGVGVPPGETVKPFERTPYAWEHNKLGRSRRVYAPFTPLAVSGREVSTVLRHHQMNGLGLWDQVNAKGRPLLAAPMRFRVWTGAGEDALKPLPLRFTEKTADCVIAEGGFRSTALSGRVRSTWDFDGMMRVDMTLQPIETRAVNGLTLDVPLRADTAKLLHAMGDGIRNTLYEAVPAGRGVVWTAERVQVNSFPRNFCTYIYVGSPVRGLCWFAENDRGWSWDPSKPNVEIARENGAVVLRVHLINQRTILSGPRTITFGIQAAPVKPRLSPWRHQWVRGNYTVLGTDINWLALGDCASVYPAGKDMHLWDMIRRGNLEKLSDADIENTIEEGRKYFEPYGPEIVKLFENHVRYNLRARYGKRMVFYYNRSSYQAADEFQTFQDEWDQTDYRSVGPGTSRGEIPIVPTESYIDHALYWYGKSFDIGGNKGVYWDNWFFNRSYNTATTGAHRKPDGTIMPSTGIWGLRELAKRTFQYMNERGMTPITMAHMTSTSILPLLSFATVQYDWEWKYSEGDVQYRFPREYIQLVSNGELAGTWPVLLGDQGPLANDPWTQRTFAAVCLVHEMTPNGMLESVWKPLLEPIFRLLDNPSVRAYRYWDDAPQPIRTGNDDLPCIVYSVKGKEAVCVVTSHAGKDQTARLHIDAAALGFPKGCQVIDTETGQTIPWAGDTIPLTIKKHDLRELRVIDGRIHL